MTTEVSSGPSDASNAGAGLMLVVMENQQTVNVLGSQNAPNITALSHTYPTATRYFGRTHPSLPNYLELWAGSTFGIADDDPPSAHPLSGETLGSQLDAAGIPWAAYFESLAPGQDPSIDGGGTDSSGDNLYVARHNPVVYFSGFAPARIKPFEELAADLDAAVAPRFCLVVPNMADNMHDPVGSTWRDATAVRDGDSWFHTLLGSVSASRWWADGGTVILVWDEAYNGSGQTVAGGIGTPPTDGGPVLCLVISKALAGIAPYSYGLGGDANWDGELTHAGLLGSIEAFFGLPRLRDASNATYGDISPLLIGSARESS